jgi:hypothetical protein
MAQLGYEQNGQNFVNNLLKLDNRLYTQDKEIYQIFGERI